jgi:peptidoglycan/LPS O-acetylase OafA/YrhL
MRALAAVSVAICHSVGTWPHFVVYTVIGRFGYLGVDFFFCLSGFVMQWAWTRGVTGRNFLTRRFSRLYPVIVLGLVASILAWHLFQSPLGGYVGPPRSVLYNLLVIQSWFFNEPTIRQSWDGVTWSLSCEMFFYACSPLLLMWVAKLKPRVCIVGLCGVFASLTVAQLLSSPTNGSTAQDFFYFFPPARLPEFIMGALACQFLINGPRIAIRHVGATFAVTTVVPLVIYCNVVAPTRQYLTITSLVVIPGFIVTICVAASRDMHRDRSSRHPLLGTRQMVWLGDVSYSYYMVHVLVLGGMGLAFYHLRIITTSVFLGSLYLTLFLVVSLLVAWLVWRVCERPGQRMLMRVLRKRGPTLDSKIVTEVRTTP